MAETLTFSKVYRYNTLVEGITVKARLSSGDKFCVVAAKIDTGASYCIFERDYCEVLGLSLESGQPQRFSTAMGSFTAYGHELSLTVLGIETYAMVYFAPFAGFGRNVLGQIGWLNRVRLGLVDSEATLYLSPAEDEF